MQNYVVLHPEKAKHAIYAQSCETHLEHVFPLCFGANPTTGRCPVGPEGSRDVCVGMTGVVGTAVAVAAVIGEEAVTECKHASKGKLFWGASQLAFGAAVCAWRPGRDNMRPGASISLWYLRWHNHYFHPPKPHHGKDLHCNPCLLCFGTSPLQSGSEP